VQALTAVQILLSPQPEFTTMQVLAPEGLVLQQPVLHRSPAQQACPFPPQPAQRWVGRQRSPLEHAAPTAAQVLVVRLRSQQPTLQLSPAQHGWVGVPQALHSPREHTVPASLHWLPAQQGWPALPHAAQTDPEQTSPGSVHWT
jgi:hypothetical protein